jgi:hypothetical protein
LSATFSKGRRARATPVARERALLLNKTAPAGMAGAEYLPLANDHKYLWICDLCQELGIKAARCIIALEQERQAKTDACLVPLCPLAS